jgi:nucleotide-binding universal stress UspA family protein
MGLAGSRAITAAMVLLCYGGSADAKAAIDHAGALLKGSPAVVLSVWEPFMGVMTRAGLGMAYGALAFDADEVDAASERGAAALAEEGTEHAREVGLDAHPRTTPRNGSVADVILDVADEADAEAIVLASRGLTGVRSLLLGSVSHAVLQHADRPVVVVPSPAVTEARAQRRHDRPSQRT